MKFLWLTLNKIHTRWKSHLNESTFLSFDDKSNNINNLF